MPSYVQAASGGHLAVLPLLTPIVCDLDPPPPAEADSHRRRSAVLSNGGNAHCSDGAASRQASEDELCDLALVRTVERWLTLKKGMQLPGACLGPHRLSRVGHDARWTSKIDPASMQQCCITAVGNSMASASRAVLCRAS